MAALSPQKLKISVVFSGGQAPGHNVISGLFGECLFKKDIFLKCQDDCFLYHCIFKGEVFICNFVFSGLDYLQERAKGSTFYGFKGGPAGIMKCKYVELNVEYIHPYRNQVLGLLLSMDQKTKTF